MASYLSNWSGNFSNSALTNTATKLTSDLHSANSWFENTPNIDTTTLYYTANYASGYFTNGGSFSMQGSGFTATQTPTINSFGIQTPDGWSFKYDGNITIDTRNGSTSGTINHIVIQSPSNKNIDITGNVYINQNSAALNNITYKFADGTITGTGSLTYNFLSNTMTGDFSSFKFVDNNNHNFVLSNITIPYQNLDAYKDLNSFVNGVMVGNDVINGTPNNDVVKGFNGNDTLNGLSGNDNLNGGPGADNLIGGLGLDTLIGGTGKDTLTGGVGNDIFDFNAYNEMGLGTTRDVITDFTRGQDKIDLSTIDPNSTLAGNQAFKFISLATAFNSPGQIHYKAGIISINTDTDTAAEYEIQLTGVAPATLTATDFVL